MYSSLCQETSNFRIYKSSMNNQVNENQNVTNALLNTE